MSISTNKYILLGLKYNPFPDAGAEAYVQSLENLVIAEIPSYRYIYDVLRGYVREIDRKVVLFMVAGEWGTGKTHTLLSFAKMLKEHYKDKALSVYIGPTPLASEKDFYSEISKHLVEELQNVWHSDSVILIDTLRNCSKQECFFESLASLRQRGYILYLALDQLEQDVSPLLRSGHTAAVEEIGQRLESFARRILQLGSGIALGLGAYSYVASASAFQDIIAKKIFDYFELKYLNYQDVEELIKRYLQEAYISEEELIKEGLPGNIIELITKLREEHPHYPFSQSAVKAFLDVCGLTTATSRCIVTHARRAIETVLSEITSEMPVIITEHYVYRSIDTREFAWANALKEWQIYMNWKTFVTAIARILSKAAQENIIDVLPSKAENEHDFRLLNIKKPYKMQDNEFLIGLRGETYVYISRRTSRRVDPDDVKEVISRALHLREVGFSIRKIVLITLTDLDAEASRWISSVKAHNISFEVVRISQEIRTLGRILFTAKHLDNRYELERLGLNLREELTTITSMLKIR